MSLRPFIRKGINNVLWKFLYETDRHNGIAEFLEILGSIINGFALPLKDEHKEFLRTVLLPLHRTTNLSSFHPQLSYCVTQFIQKDPALAPRIVRAILKYWPRLASRKEILFLNELEEVLDRIQPVFLEEVQIALFRQIARSMESSHFQVAERAIYVLNSDTIMRFISTHRETLIPILYNALCRNTNSVALAALSGNYSLYPSTNGTNEAEGSPTSSSKDSLSISVTPASPSTASPNVSSLVPDPSNAIAPPSPRWDAHATVVDEITRREVEEERKRVEDKEARGHWNPTVAQLTADILKVFAEMDPALISRLHSERIQRSKKLLSKHTVLRHHWKNIAPTVALAPVKVRGYGEDDDPLGYRDPYASTSSPVVVLSSGQSNSPSLSPPTHSVSLSSISLQVSSASPNAQTKSPTSRSPSSQPPSPSPSSPVAPPPISLAAAPSSPSTPAHPSPSTLDSTLGSPSLASSVQS